MLVLYNNCDLSYRKEDNIRESHWKHGRDTGDIGVLGAEGFDINGRSGEDGLLKPGIRKNGEERCEIQVCAGRGWQQSGMMKPVCLSTTTISFLQ